MPVLQGLEPRSVFSFFERLCAIPHGSGNTDVVSRWLESFARDRGLKYRRDGMNNVVIFGAASPGYEDAPAVILQGHMDMVCEKEPDCPLDMERDSLDLAVEGDTVLARGTTLGGDDGVAVAMMLALLDDRSLPHPRLECVFTVDEEIGMLGAMGLDVSDLTGRTMINMDSEDEGIFTVSCAGGRVAACRIPVTREPFAGTVLRLGVAGLTGGHSGTEIIRGRANADRLLGRVLHAAMAAAPLRIVEVRGGMKDNAIPVSAAAALVTEDAAAVTAACRELEAKLREEYAVTDPGLSLTVEPGEEGLEPFSRESTERVVTLLLCAPNGVQAMSPDIPGLVQTSLNLGTLNTAPEAVEAGFCLRSSLESQKLLMTQQLERLCAALGGSVSISGDYPGWAFRRESPLRDLMSAVYQEQYGKPPVVEAIHAGLECGLFAGKLPGLDCVSLGPDLSDIHTPRERMHIASVARTWRLLLETLKRMKA